MENIIFYTVLILLFVIWFRWRWRKTCIFDELGIPGPRPNFWFGNMLELNEKGPIKCEKEWIKKYGNVVGYYYGMKPILMISDVELLKKIFIKDFNSFTDRPEGVPLRSKGILDYILPTRAIFDSLLVNMKGQRWKEVRKILNPTFSSAKMKLMIPLMDEALDITVAKVEEQVSTGNSFDIYDMFRRLTLDIICKTAFAVPMNSQNEPKNAFFTSAELMLAMKYNSILMLLGASFPEFASLIMAFNFGMGLIKNRFVIPPLKVAWMIGDVIKQRRRDGKDYVDLLQLMMKASVDEMAENGVSSPHKISMRLTDKEIQANALVIFLAGFESTSTVLAYIFYLLVKYPKYQAVIRNEVCDMVNNDNQLNYSSVSKLQHLDRFFLETMRLYPPIVNIICRIANTDVQYDGLHITKDMQVQLPIYYMHHNSEHWKNPEEFNPDRFLPANKHENFNVTYVPFGVGPRNCLGIRFATMEAKLAVAKLLHKFVFVADENEPEINIQMKLVTRVPERVLVKACEPTEYTVQPGL